MNTTSTTEFFDAELAAVWPVLNDQLTLNVAPDSITALRDFATRFAPTAEALIEGHEVRHVEHSIPGYDGAEIVLSVFTRVGHTGSGPGIYYTHGGGMISGSRFIGGSDLVNWVELYDAVAVSVEYRVAPEFPDPVPVEDCYAGLLWMVEHADELGIDPARVMIAGQSAGGGLAAGTALLARDRQGPKLLAQLLMCPMLDDRNETASSHQFDSVGPWNRHSNTTGWDALLGDRRGTTDVSIYAAPARAEDLSGLPPTYIDVGSAEVFRDEDVAYASKIWACGGSAELHVWNGGFHGFDLLAPHTSVAIEARQTREVWVAGRLGS
jgi:acetyl esterase/lipase